MSPAVSRANARQVCAAVALLAVFIVFSWTVLRIHYACGGNWTAVFYTGTTFRVPPDLDVGTYRFEGTGYDGQFYRYLAHDPFLEKGYFRYVDAPQLRFRRLLVPLAAWLIGFGRQPWIDGAYVGVEMLFLALGGYWSARLLARRGRSPLWGLAFLVVPATLASFDRMLVDGPLTALFAGYLLYCEEQRWNRVWLVAMLAALTRDTGLLFIAALVTDRLLHHDWRRAAWFASGAMPTLAWYVYVATHLPPDGPVSVLAVPGWGLLRRLLLFRTYPDPRVQLLLRVTDFLAVVGLATSIGLVMCWLTKYRAEPVTLCVGFFAVLALVLGAPAHMLDPFGFGRPVSPLLLWLMIEAVSRKAWSALAAPLLLSLSVSLAFGNSIAAVMKGILGR